MNILHHKSYHVYNKKNIEKVRKDEEKAADKEKEKQKRVDLAESEARLKLLRERAGEQNLPSKKIEHINLFKDLESTKNNEEHEKEEKEKAEKLDRQTTVYLGGDAQKGSDPWYAKKPDFTEKYKDHHIRKSNRQKRRDPIELLDDPLKYMQHKLGKDKTKEKQKERKEKKRKLETGSSSIEELRAKRIEREKIEKKRVKELYLQPDEESYHEPKGYNSQYNKKETLLAKQTKKRHH